MKKLKQLLFFESSQDVDVKQFRAEIREENRRSAVIWSAFQILYWTYCVIMTTRDPDFLICRPIYLVSLAVCAAALILATIAAPRAPWLIGPIALAVDVAFLGAGIFIAMHLAPKTIVIFASVLVVPVFFICDSLSTLSLLALNAAVFAVVGKGMDPETYRWTLVNLIIFSSIGFFLGYFINKARFERYYFAQSAVKLAESNAKLAELQTRYAYYDPMTNFRNRRAYAELIDSYAGGKPSGCCVIMADINGLKEMNDTYGHDAGDELIIGAAECMRNAFGRIDSIYRIGGDEFCVVLNGTAEHAKECIRQLGIVGEAWKSGHVDGISISCGFVSDGEFDDFESMLKAADQRMYEAKSEYYRTTGNDRRRADPRRQTTFDPCDQARVISKERSGNRT